MARRRFVPSAENLEGRQLMAAGFLNGYSNASTTSVPLATISEKMTRIERLPYFLRSLDTSRPLPQEPVKEIQADLDHLKGTLHAASTQGLNAFNAKMRGVLSEASISPSESARLNTLFGKVVASAGASEEVTQSLQNAMNGLVQSEIVSAQNAPFVVANDYSIVLETVLGIGKPMRAPQVPRLATGQTAHQAGGYVTRVHQPEFAGQYDKGESMAVQLVDSKSGAVLGSAAVSPSGTYSVKPAAPLSPGHYVLHVVAVDTFEGATSRPSRNFPLWIQGPATPAGPLGLKSPQGG
jgi:hypothetical protein